MYFDVVLANASSSAKAGKRPRKFIMAKGYVVCLSLSVALSTIQTIVRFDSFTPQFWGRTRWGWSGAFHLPPVSREDLERDGYLENPHAFEDTIDFQTSIPPIRYSGGSLNSRRASSPLVRLVEGEKEWEALNTSRGSPAKLGWKQVNSYCHLHGAQG
ncbi:hypothetical protein TNCV_952991 [Trichonephila clavipes]|nr:hypothetical protein TNCV_952991 [Trichonephila clavipes]